MRRTIYSESEHTVTGTTPPADGPSANSGLPNRLMTAFEVAEFVGCHEETVRSQNGCRMRHSPAPVVTVMGSVAPDPQARTAFLAAESRVSATRHGRLAATFAEEMMKRSILRPATPSENLFERVRRRHLLDAPFTIQADGFQKLRHL